MKMISPPTARTNRNSADSKAMVLAALYRAARAAACAGGPGP